VSQYFFRGVWLAVHDRELGRFCKTVKVFGRIFEVSLEDIEKSRGLLDSMLLLYIPSRWDGAGLCIL